MFTIGYGKDYDAQFLKDCCLKINQQAVFQIMNKKFDYHNDARDSSSLLDTFRELTSLFDTTLAERTIKKLQQ
jgi:hypothetical protein